ncbi:MAG: PQQ-dependent sugar dehydrogenase, partial [Bryobacteraceae bacterium]
MTILCAALLLPAAAFARSDAGIKHIVTGKAAFDSYRTEKPGRTRKITLADLPAPDQAGAVANPPTIVPRAAKSWPQAPAGFEVELYADQL